MWLQALPVPFYCVFMTFEAGVRPQLRIGRGRTEQRPIALNHCMHICESLSHTLTDLVKSFEHSICLRWNPILYKTRNFGNYSDSDITFNGLVTGLYKITLMYCCTPGVCRHQNADFQHRA